MKKIYTLLLLGYLTITTAYAQFQKQTTNKDLYPLVENSIFFGITGGMAVPFSLIANTQTTGGFGQVDFFFLIKHNLAIGLDYGYFYFPGKQVKGEKNIDIPFHEVMISGTYFFNYRLNPNFAFGLSYYGEPGTSHFGYIPSIGIMPRINDWFFLNAKFSVAFFNMDGHFFKLGGGIIFKIVQHKPVKNY